MTTQTVTHMQHETFRSNGEPAIVVLDDFPAELTPARGLQDCPPAEAFFVRDAVAAMPQELADHFPEDIVTSARSKVAAATELSVVLSMRQSILYSVLAPKDVSAAEFEAMEEERERATSVAVASNEDTETVLYVPDFDDEEPLDSRTEHLLACAVQLAANDITKAKRSQAANEAIAAAEADAKLRAKIASAIGAPSDDETYTAATIIERDACKQRTLAELTAATHEPIHLTHGEAAVVTAAMHHYDPEAHRAELAKDLLSVENEPSRTPVERLGSVAVQEFTGYDAMRERVAVWTAGIVARTAAAGRAGEAVAKLVDRAYVHVHVFKALLLQ